MFNSTVKVNVETFEKYILDSFKYMLKDITSDWCHNYMLKFPNYNFLKLAHAFCKCCRKIQNDEQIHMELKTMKQEEIENGGGLLQMDLEACSWFTSTNHIQFFN